MHAPCDMTTDGGGWIVFQRRIYKTNFYQNWATYKAGFGNQNENFWLGLDKLHMLAAPGRNAILRVDLKKAGEPNKIYYALYRTFSIGDAASSFQLTVGNYTGTAGDSLSYHNLQKFSTYDEDHDTSPQSCAGKWSGAWWYADCLESCLNAVYSISNTNNKIYISWGGLGSYGNVIFSEMKISYY